MSELTERLRAGAGGGSHWMELHREAADALEAQEAKIAELETEKADILSAIAGVQRYRCMPGNNVASHVPHNTGEWVRWGDISFIGMGPIYG